MPHGNYRTHKKKHHATVNNVMKEAINRLRLRAGTCYWFLKLVIIIKLLISVSNAIFTWYNSTLRTFGIGVFIIIWLGSFVFFDAMRRARQPRCLYQQHAGAVFRAVANSRESLYSYFTSCIAICIPQICTYIHGPGMCIIQNASWLGY